MSKNKLVWVTKTGSQIRVCDMEDRHLSNTIRMLERNLPLLVNRAINEGEHTLALLHGEQASYSVEADLRHLESGDVELEELCLIYSELCDERRKRGLV